MCFLNWELAACLETIYEILDDLEDIKTLLEEKRDLTFYLFPPTRFLPPPSYQEIVTPCLSSTPYYPLPSPLTSFEG